LPIKVKESLEGQAKPNLTPNLAQRFCRRDSYSGLAVLFRLAASMVEPGDVSAGHVQHEIEGIEMEATTSAILQQAVDIFPQISGTRVLVVEDEAVTALHLRRELTKLGYTVAGVATSGEQALKMIEETFPDVVLMDIHIQGEIDGIETAKRIPRYLHIPVIFLTAYSEDATLGRAGETHPYGYLLKPFLDRELHATIKMALVRSRADEAVRENEAMLFTALVTTPIAEC
jgi:CheY-like chemotaxis protein